MPKFRKKPVVIEAFQWTGDIDQLDYPIWFIDAIKKPWGKPRAVRFVNRGLKNVCMEIFTLEGSHFAKKGDFIIRGVKGELYPCKPDIFKETYEPVCDS